MTAPAILVGAWLLVTPIKAAGSVAGDGTQQSIAGETIAVIQVHGNNVTPDAEVLAASGITVGQPFTEAVLADVRRRLLASNRYEDVTVLKRYASIEDPSRISVVMLVNERAVRIEAPRLPGDAPRLRRRGPLRNLMFMPVLEAEDGHGVTYGARLAYVDVPGKGSRFAFPLTWGGTKRAGAEFEQTFKPGSISRVQVGTAVERRRNPAFDADDDRRKVWARVERTGGPLRVAAFVGTERVTFINVHDRLGSVGADVTVDTRLDPALPWNAVYVRAAWTQFRVQGRAIYQASLDARGYLGLVGQTILVGRVTRTGAWGPLPLYLKPLLGGWSTLRGFKAGAFVGDTVATASAELKVPLSSPLRVARTGISVFVDTGAAADDGQRLAAQPLHVGVGAGVWTTATVFHLGISAAHGRGAGTRLNFGVGVTF
jgi:outer membrane protein assembly factor BamA